MELCLNLDDDDFCEIEKRPKEKETIAYIPKQCNPNWFLNNENKVITPDQTLTDLKFAADSAFMKKNFTEAIDLYNKILHVPYNNKVTIDLLHMLCGPFRYG